MDEDQGVAPVQSLHDGREIRMAGIALAVTGHELNAVRLERVEGVSDLGKRSVDVRHRHRSEMPVARRMGRAHRRGMLVDRSREPPRLLRAELMKAWWRQRQDRRANPVLIHFLEAAGD